MAELNLTFDRYRALRELGRGGAAVVYEAEHTGLGTRHALKLMNVQSEVVRRRMMSEARLQASLRHRNLIAVTDVFEVDERPVVIMELVDGPSLEQWLIAEGLPSHQEAERLFRGIVAGVAVAHAAGVVHRDLKPANVMLELRGGRLEPRVTDFGLAKALARKGDTKMGVAMGTPGYMAPELIEKAATADERADIFSLGCVLYAMLAGRIPFMGENVLDSLNRTNEGRYTPLSELAPEAPEHLLRAVERCLQVDRELRPKSCEELLQLMEPPRITQPAQAAKPALEPAPKPAKEPAARVEPPRRGDPLPRPAPAPAPTVEPVDERPPPTMRRVVGALLLLAGLAMLAWMSDQLFSDEPAAPPTTTLPGER